LTKADLQKALAATTTTVLKNTSDKYEEFSKLYGTSSST
jgi:hypothetical protein